MVHAPDVIGMARHDGLARELLGFGRRWHRSLRLGLRSVAEHALDGACGEVQAAPSEDLSDSGFAHGGARGLELTHEHGNEVREAIHGFRHGEQRALPALVEASKPASDGQRCDEESPRELGGGPAGLGLDGQDLQALGRREMRAVGGRNPLEARAKQSVLSLDEREPRPHERELASETDARQRAVFGPSADESHAPMGERDGAEPTALHVVGPLRGREIAGVFTDRFSGSSPRGDNGSMDLRCAVITGAPVL